VGPRYPTASPFVALPTAKVRAAVEAAAGSQMFAAPELRIRRPRCNPFPLSAKIVPGLCGLGAPQSQLHCRKIGDDRAIVLGQPPIDQHYPLLVRIEKALRLG
jgi:hypothetical protein